MLKTQQRAYVLAMNTPPDKINGHIFNVGFDEQNHQILPLLSWSAGLLMWTTR